LIVATGGGRWVATTATTTTFLYCPTKEAASKHQKPQKNTPNPPKRRSPHQYHNIKQPLKKTAKHTQIN